jgi:hypothetical protein
VFTIEYDIAKKIILEIWRNKKGAHNGPHEDKDIL